MSEISDARRPAAPVASSSERDRRVDMVAALSFVAAGLHFWVAEPHVLEWWAYGGFFLATGVGQTALALLILRGTPPWLLLTGIVGNLAILGMYVLSRTNGPPLGPHTGRAEPAALLDITCAIAELGTIVALAGLLPARMARHTATVVALIGVALWTGRLTGLLL